MTFVQTARMVQEYEFKKKKKEKKIRDANNISSIFFPNKFIAGKLIF